LIFKHKDIAKINEDDKEAWKRADFQEIQALHKKGRSKHMDIRYHFIRDLVSGGRLKIEYLETDIMEADAFTKALAFPRFNFLMRKIMGMGI